MFDFLMRHAEREKLIPLLGMFVLFSAVTLNCLGIWGDYHALVRRMAEAGLSLPPAKGYCTVIGLRYPVIIMPSLLSLGVFVLLVKKPKLPFGGTIGAICTVLNIVATFCAGFAVYEVPLFEILKR